MADLPWPNAEELYKRFYSVEPHRVIVTPEELPALTEFMWQMARKSAELLKLEEGGSGWPLFWVGNHGLPLVLGVEVEVVGGDVES